MGAKNQTYEEIKQTYLNHATDPDVIKKLSPSHIVNLKKVELEERKLNMADDALRKLLLGNLLGGSDVIDGEIDKEVEGNVRELLESGDGLG